jgi:mRNA-degrading endonuclease RelE of RelBE toxin-antitoxin system
MIYKIKKLKQAEKEIADLTKIQQKALKDDFETIETKGLEFVKRRYLREGLFEIKTNDVRALFKFQEEQIILIGLVYEKRSNKAPDYYINLAQKRLKEV